MLKATIFVGVGESAFKYEIEYAEWDISSAGFYIFKGITKCVRYLSPTSPVGDTLSISFLKLPINHTIVETHK